MKTYRTLLAQARQEESGASLILAIIMLTVLAALVAGMTLVTVALAQSTMAVRDATYFDIATGTAISDALSRLNSLEEGQSADDFLGEGNMVTGEVDGNIGVRWQWYLVAVESWDRSDWLDVVATGYRSDSSDPATARTVVARLRPFPTPGARTIGDSIFYRPTKESIYSWGFFGADGVTLTEGTTVDAYNSSFETVWRAASPGSNKNIAINDTAEVDALNFMDDYVGHSIPERCSGHNICNDSNSISRNRFGLDLSVISEWVAEECGNDPLEHPDVIGSSITLSVNTPNCFNEVHLDGEVEIEYSDAAPTAENPARVYVMGDLRFDQGTKFNNTTGLSAAIGVHIFSAGTVVNVGVEGDPVEGTDVRAMIAADKATCTFGPGRFWGASVCREVETTEEGSELLWDFATTKLALAGPAHQRIYEVVSMTQDVQY